MLPGFSRVLAVESLVLHLYLCASLPLCLSASVCSLWHLSVFLFFSCTYSADCLFHLSPMTGVCIVSREIAVPCAGSRSARVARSRARTRRLSSSPRKCFACSDACRPTAPRKSRSTMPNRDPPIRQSPEGTGRACLSGHSRSLNVTGRTRRNSILLAWPAAEKHIGPVQRTRGPSTPLGHPAGIRQSRAPRAVSEAIRSTGRCNAPVTRESKGITGRCGTDPLPRPLSNMRAVQQTAVAPRDSRPGGLKRRSQANAATRSSGGGSYVGSSDSPVSASSSGRHRVRDTVRSVVLSFFCTPLPFGLGPALPSWPFFQFRMPHVARPQLAESGRAHAQPLPILKPLPCSSPF